MHRQLCSVVMALVVSLLSAGAARGAAPPARESEAVPTGRLPRDVVPSHVGLALRIDPAQTRFSGTVRLDVRVARATRTVWLHGRDLHITRATVTVPGGRPQPLVVSLADESGVLRLESRRPLAAGRARIELAYDAPFGQLQGAYRVKVAEADYVMSQMEALGARSTFPVFDEPGFKPTWDLRLTIPDRLRGVANTRQLTSRPAGKGWKTLTFATTEPLPSYLIAFAVGPWDIVDAAPLPPNAVRHRPLALRGIAPQGQGARMRTMLGETAAIVAAEEAYFGIAYPYDKLDLLAAPDFGAGAMENAGLIYFRDRLMYADDRSEAWLRLAAYGTLTHELSHQWFGDLVTMAWWDDLWLNEAFATWFAAKISDQVKGTRHGERYQLGASLRAMGEDSLASTRRIREPIGLSTDIISAFDGITYDKGAAVLGMVERSMGADRFRAGIRAYLRRHARGNAASDDLVGALAEASDNPAAVRAAFASFLDQPGVPMLAVVVDCSGPMPALKVEQQRYLPVGSSASVAGEWRIPMCLRWGDAQGVQSQCELVGSRAATIALKAASCPAWVMPNANGAGYYRFALMPADAARLSANFERLDEREQRVYADSVAAAFTAGALDVQGFLRAAATLATAPARETALAPLVQLEWILLHLPLTSAQQVALRDFVRQAYGPRLHALGTTPRPGDTEDDLLMRGDLMEAVAALGRDPTLRAALAAQGRRLLGLQGDADATPGDGRLHLNAVAPDQRGLALGLAMEEGDVRVFDALATQLAASQDASLRSDLLSAIARARQPELQVRARALLLGPDAVRLNEVSLLLGPTRGRAPARADDPAARAAAREWIDAHFEEMAARVAPFGAGLAEAYAEGLCSAAEAEAMQRRFAERVRPLEGGPRALAQASEGVRLCAALQAAQRGGAWQVP